MRNLLIADAEGFAQDVGLLVELVVEAAFGDEAVHVQVVHVGLLEGLEVGFGFESGFSSFFCPELSVSLSFVALAEFGAEVADFVGLLGERLHEAGDGVRVSDPSVPGGFVPVCVVGKMDGVFFACERVESVPDAGEFANTDWDYSNNSTFEPPPAFCGFGSWVALLGLYVCNGVRKGKVHEMGW